jgi:hypothetical protein
MVAVAVAGEVLMASRATAVLLAAFTVQGVEVVAAMVLA